MWMNRKHLELDIGQNGNQNVIYEAGSPASHTHRRRQAGVWAGRRAYRKWQVLRYIQHDARSPCITHTHCLCIILSNVQQQQEQQQHQKKTKAGHETWIIIIIHHNLQEKCQICGIEYVIFFIDRATFIFLSALLRIEHTHTWIVWLSDFPNVWISFMCVCFAFS